jgi:ATP-binding cassette, subfamily B, bacterial CvaB/MchF/RaxB
MRYHQSEHSECGLVCLAYASSRLGAHLDLADLRRKFPVSSRGLNLQQVSEIAAAMDMMARPVRCEVEELSQLKLPAILHWGLKHFVVLEKVRRDHIICHDPAVGRIRVYWPEVGKRFTGVAMELSQAPTFKPRSPPPEMSVWAWLRLSRETFGGLGQVLLMSLMLQAYVIASPFYMQLAIDQAALKGDGELLKMLAIGFALFGLFNLGATVLRNFAMQQVSTQISWDMSLRLYRHLVRLPLDWFQKRRLADTISRFDAINPVRDLLAGSMITAVIDGVLAVSTLVMMAIFSWKLALIVVFAMLGYVVIKLSGLPTSIRLGGESLAAQIAEQSKRIETIKAIQTIKVMSGESHQEAQWSNRYLTSLRKKMTSGNFTSSIDAGQQVFDVIGTVLIVYSGVTSIMTGELTVGVLYAFVAYKSQFTLALSRVVDLIIQWRLSEIYTSRLSDIVLSPRENGIDILEPADLPPIEGRIELESVTFRYAPYEPFVFRNLHLKIEPGDFVAIVGPSGAGKSTLLKVMCGLYQPVAGEVRLDGRPLSAWGPKAVRRACGVVLQDDELLSGSIAENVAFFDEEIDMDRVWQALEAAALKDEILAMPMKAESFVGDMGGSLSGGQKQRLLIARALYRRPRILLFDEATSHLDARNEGAINMGLKALNITRVVIAHRKETIAAADMVFDITSGRVTRNTLVTTSFLPG